MSSTLAPLPPSEAARAVRYAWRWKLGAALAVVLLVLIAGSAARLVIPGVRENTRASTLVLRPATSARVDTSIGHGAERVSLNSGKPRPGVVQVAPAKISLPRAPRRLLAPAAARAPGDEALGTGSLPRSRRWAVLGGHGRHGAG